MLKKNRIYSLLRNPDNPKMPKSALNIDMSGYSNNYWLDKLFQGLKQRNINSGGLKLFRARSSKLIGESI